MAMTPDPGSRQGRTDLYSAAAGRAAAAGPIVQGALKKTIVKATYICQSRYMRYVDAYFSSFFWGSFFGRFCAFPNKGSSKTPKRKLEKSSCQKQIAKQGGGKRFFSCRFFSSIFLIMFFGSRTP
jgi:hypothetical protein